MLHSYPINWHPKYAQSFDILSMKRWLVAAPINRRPEMSSWGMLFDRRIV